VEEHEVYAAIGNEGFERLIAAFYKQIPNDDILGPMYRGRDLAAAEQRLRSFLIYRFGGPQLTSKRAVILAFACATRHL